MRRQYLKNLSHDVKSGREAIVCRLAHKAKKFRTWEINLYVRLRRPYASIRASNKMRIGMPTPIKPCEGKLSEEAKEALSRNRNREQWATHLCETCGRRVGVELAMGKWQTERHWPSVAYPARKVVPVKPASFSRKPSGPALPAEVNSEAS